MKTLLSQLAQRQPGRERQGAEADALRLRDDGAKLAFRLAGLLRGGVDAGHGQGRLEVERAVLAGGQGRLGAPDLGEGVLLASPRQGGEGEHGPRHQLVVRCRLRSQPGESFSCQGLRLLGAARFDEDPGQLDPEARRPEFLAQGLEAGDGRLQLPYRPRRSPRRASTCP